jgi:CRISPR type III-A-associated RAMP protein Csm4
LMVRLTPDGPWRIGPDSGARNHVDPVYHSDSLYGAVSAAMDRLGVFEEWLDATARRSVAAVAFSSCFPFVEEVNLVVPPRTLWPPSSPALLASRVRWKSARFVPLSLIPLLVARAPLADPDWSVDGASQCLLPAGKPGPFRSGLRFHAAVDRLTGIGERHSVACLEFRPGAGLWTLVSFADEAARERWSDRVKAAFRLLADSGFGGERSQGWGHAAPPEFTEGWLPEMILPAAAAKRSAAPSPEPPPPESTEAAGPNRDREGAVAEQPAPPEAESSVTESTEAAVPEQSETAGVEPSVAESTEAAINQPATADAESVAAESTEAASQSRDHEGAAPEQAPTAEATEPAAAAQSASLDTEAAATESTEAASPSRDREGAVAEQAPTPEATESAAAEQSALPDAEAAPAESTEVASPSRDNEEAVAEQAPTPEPTEAVVPEQPAPPDAEPAPAESPEPAIPGQPAPDTAEAAVRQSPEIAPLFAPTPGPPAQPSAAHWLLSLFTPAPSDRVDWTRGTYTLVARAGRVAGSGELKKTAQMIAEGSVLYAPSAPSGNALDVAPDGLAHPVFRAGFAVSVPLPEVG